MTEVAVDIMGVRIVKRGPLLSAKQGTEASEAPQGQVHHDGQLGAHKQGQRAGPLQQPPQHPGLCGLGREREELWGQAGGAQASPEHRAGVTVGPGAQQTGKAGREDSHRWDNADVQPCKGKRWATTLTAHSPATCHFQPESHSPPPSRTRSC